MWVRGQISGTAVDNGYVYAWKQENMQHLDWGHTRTRSRSLKAIDHITIDNSGPQRGLKQSAGRELLLTSGWKRRKQGCIFSVMNSKIREERRGNVCVVGGFSVCVCELHQICVCAHRLCTSAWVHMGVSEFALLWFDHETHTHRRNHTHTFTFQCFCRDVDQ